MERIVHVTPRVRRLHRELPLSRQGMVKLIAGLHDNLRHHAEACLQDRLPDRPNHYRYQYVLRDGDRVHAPTYVIHDNPQTGRLEVVWLEWGP